MRLVLVRILPAVLMAAGLAPGGRAARAQPAQSVSGPGDQACRAAVDSAESAFENALAAHQAAYMARVEALDRRIAHLKTTGRDTADIYADPFNPPAPDPHNAATAMLERVRGCVEAFAQEIGPETARPRSESTGISIGGPWSLDMSGSHARALFTAPLRYDDVIVGELIFDEPEGDMFVERESEGTLTVEYRSHAWSARPVGVEEEWRMRLWAASPNARQIALSPGRQAPYEARLLPRERAQVEKMSWAVQTTEHLSHARIQLWAQVGSRPHPDSALVWRDSVALGRLVDVRRRETDWFRVVDTVAAALTALAAVGAFAIFKSVGGRFVGSDWWTRVRRWRPWRVPRGSST